MCFSLCFGKAMFAERQDALLTGKRRLSGKQKRREPSMSNNSSNRINIPEARQAMDQFKMQAASDEDVSSTS